MIPPALSPMEAVAALYSGKDAALAAEIFQRLGEAVFDADDAKPAGVLKRALSVLSYAVLLATMRSSRQIDARGEAATVHRNWILSRSGHPYAAALMISSRDEHSALVEGGDPMNGPYMMLVPELRGRSGVWDRLFLDSVQGRDVKARLAWETRAVHEMAKARLRRGEAVRMKSVAAGTGLSLILVYDRLMRDGFSPALISAHITDKDPANIAKARHLLGSLAAARGDSRRERAGEGEHEHEVGYGGRWGAGIVAHTEDIFSAEAPAERFHIVTAIGILEYFHGSTASKTEDRTGDGVDDSGHSAHDLIRALRETIADDGHVIVNCFKHDMSTRILELFGKRFDYREPEHLRALMTAGGFEFERLAGSGNIYDVEVYRKEHARR